MGLDKLDRRGLLGRRGPFARRGRRWGGPDRLEERGRPSRSLMVALLLACLTLITLDYRGGADSPTST